MIFRQFSRLLASRPSHNYFNVPARKYAKKKTSKASLTSSMYAFLSKFKVKLPCFHFIFFYSELFDETFLEEMRAKDHDVLLQHYKLKVMDTQQVIIVQPWYHHTHPNFKTNTNEDLMMAESIGLVKTMGWTMVDGVTITIREASKKNFLGDGQVERLKQLVAEHESKEGVAVTALFLSAYRLNARQRSNIESVLGIPV